MAGIGEKRASDDAASSSFDCVWKKGKTDNYALMEMGEVYPEAWQLRRLRVPAKWVKSILMLLWRRAVRRGQVMFVASSSFDCESKKEKTVLDEYSLAETRDKDEVSGRMAEMLDNLPVDVVSNEACTYDPEYYFWWHDEMDCRLRVKEYQLFLISMNQRDYAEELQSSDDILELESPYNYYREMFDNKGWSFGPLFMSTKPNNDYYDYLRVHPAPEEEDEMLYSNFYNVPLSFLDDKNYDKLYNAVSEKIQSYISYQDACVIAECIRHESFPQMSTRASQLAANDRLKELEWKLLTEEYIRLYSKLWDGTFNSKLTSNNTLTSEDKCDNYQKMMGELYDDRESYPKLKKSIEKEFCSQDGFPLFVEKKESNGDWRAAIRDLFTEAFGRRVVLYTEYAKLKISVATMLEIVRESGIAFQ